MKATTISILIAAVLIGGGVVLTRGNKDSQIPVSNVSIVDGTQVITIKAKGGYWPKVTTAKAGIPTVIRMDTKGTFDCTAALTIPSLGYQKNLPPSGETLIPAPPQNPGTTVRGICAMGMYSFAVNFN